MKLTLALLATISHGSIAFAPNAHQKHLAFSSSAVVLHANLNADMSGNTWKPDAERGNTNKMGSTDTGDFFPDDWNPNAQPGFMDGMMGSQEMLSGRKNGGPQLPGMEHLGEDAILMGGIEENSEIPPGMQFIPSSVPDGEVEFTVAANSKGSQRELEIRPFCMSFEDYYAAFAPGSHPSLKVSPCAGRMDRRGGESTFLTISCSPGGQAGTFTGNLVINLPEDNSKLTYKVQCVSF